jgi:hypothetical protein
MRTIVIADAHGQPELVERPLRHAGYDKKNDRLVFAGDFLDIGDRPAETLALLQNNDAQMLWGNHEYAVLTETLITPQDARSWEYADLLHETFESRAWPLAVCVDEVIITHAGVCELFADDFAACDRDPDALVEMLNQRFYQQAAYDLAYGYSFQGSITGEHGPLWYRPNSIAPLEVEQVAGHTPPGDICAGPRFHLIDPFEHSSQGPAQVEDCYRYAVIEDGAVTVVDSRRGIEGDVSRGQR